jgi:hypothetical protein
MRRTLILGLAAGAAWLAGCGDEDPTSLGSEIIGSGYRTFEVVLEAGTFLQQDTTYSAGGSLNGAPFGLVAESFEGALMAHTLFRVDVPERASWTDEANVPQEDSDFNIVGATLTLVVDSLSDSTEGMALELLPVTESWDPATVTWALRSDTSETPEAWTVPGGTTGEVVTTATWESVDTLRIPLDSAQAAIWQDSAQAFHGAMLRSATPGSRLRIQSLDFAFRLRPASEDTIVPGGFAEARVVVATPEAPPPGPTELRVGGLPAWRSGLRFRPLADVTVPCSPESTGCTVPLSEVTLNLATLVLYPLPLGPHRPERPMRVEGRTAVSAPGVPLSRWALSAAFGTMQNALEPALFSETPPDPAVARVPMTGYVRNNVDPPEGEEPLLWTALLAVGEQSSPLLGYAAFGSLASSQPPQLTLVVTVPVREEP